MRRVPEQKYHPHASKFSVEKTWDGHVYSTDMKEKIHVQIQILIQLVSGKRKTVNRNLRQTQYWVRRGHAI